MSQVNPDELVASIQNAFLKLSNLLNGDAPATASSSIVTEAYARTVRSASARQEPSWKWEPLKLAEAGHPMHVKHYGDCIKSTWANTRYIVSRREYRAGWPVGNAKWIQLGIANTDTSARHDWRDFQRIKNQLAGETWRAVEVYPAESELIDPSNYYLLWCAPADALPIGMSDGRTVLGPDKCLAPQRPWAAGDEPKELRARKDRES